MIETWNRRGRAWVFGDDIGIESISPLRYMLSPAGRGLHCLESVDPAFAKALKEGDLIVAGRLFGHGPGHDHAVLAIKESGIGGVIAESFAPQFFRHAIGHGLLVASSAAVGTQVSGGDELEVDFQSGEARNLSTGAVFAVSVPAGPARDIVAAGGLLPFIRSSVRSQTNEVPPFRPSLPARSAVSRGKR